MWSFGNHLEFTTYPLFIYLFLKKVCNVQNFSQIFGKEMIYEQIYSQAY